MEVTIPRVFHRTIAKFPNKVAIVSPQKKLTYEELGKRVQALACALYQVGLRRGDIVAIMMRNRHELLESVLAAAEIGAVANLVNFRCSKRELEYIMKHSRSKMIICEQEFIPTVDAILGFQPELMVVVGDAKGQKGIDYENLILEQDSKEFETALSEKDDFLLLYTSGTTGKPKGVVLTHHNMVWTLVTLAMEFGFDSEDVGGFLTPLFHISALTRALTMIFVGGTVVAVDGFEPEEVLRIIERERITFSFIVPTMFTMLYNYVQENGLHFDTSSLTKYINGAGHLSMKRRAKISAIFPQAKFFNTYGMTEHPAPILLEKPGQKSIIGEGLAQVISTEVRIVDSWMQDLPRGEVGEIVVRGPAVMRGYYKDEAATSQTIKGDWLLTGDLGSQDEHGTFYLAGRSKDMIKSGGENIFPKEIEEVLLEHPMIKEVAVIGVPDDIWGEAVKAYLTLREVNSLSKQDVLDFCSRHLAGYKKPKYLEFVPDLPKNSSGKIDKGKLGKLI